MIIDFHLHYLKKPDFISETLKKMDRDGIDCSLVLASTGLHFAGYEMGNNEDVLSAVKSYSDRLLGAMYIDPRDSKAIRTITRYYNEGFKCIKMFPPVGFYPDDPRYTPVFEHINDLGLTILCHTGQTNVRFADEETNKKQSTHSIFAEPIHLDGPARRYPDINFVLAHMGYPFNLEAWSLAHANENVYLDISGAGPWVTSQAAIYNGINRGIPIDFKKVTWGSDNCYPPAESIEELVGELEKMGMPEENRKEVLGKTAAKLLDLNI